MFMQIRIFFANVVRKVRSKQKLLNKRITLTKSVTSLCLLIRETLNIINYRFYLLYRYIASLFLSSHRQKYTKEDLVERETKQD